MATKKAETTKKKTTTKTVSKKTVKKPAVKTVTKKVKEPKKPKVEFKTVSKAKNNQFIKFFTEYPNCAKYVNMPFSNTEIIRVLDVRGDEIFVNLENNYYMYNKASKIAIDFGDIFQIGIDSMMDIPWQEPAPTIEVKKEKKEEAK